MWWFIGFVTLLLIALRIDFKIGVKGSDESWTWDGPQLVADILERLRS